MLLNKTALAATAALAACVLGLTACSGPADSNTQTTGASGTLTLGLVATATTFEAANMNWDNESPYSQAVYDTLLHADPSGAKVEPNLATAWTYDADKTVLDMTLRSGVRFTDGSTFDASVAAQNLQRFQKGSSQYAANLSHMKSATAIDPTHLRITLTEPDPGFLTYLSAAAGAQESPKAFSAATVKTIPVGSGPYVLDSKNTVVGSSYVFTKNPKYWNKSEQHYAKVVMNVYQTAAALLSAIQGGQVDLSTSFDNTANAQVKAAGYTLKCTAFHWEGLMLLDREGKVSKPLGDVRVRQAINYAFNKPALLKTLGSGQGTLTSSVYAPSSSAYEKSLDSFYGYDLAKAKSLLAEAGYPNGFTLQMSTVSSIATTNALVQQQLGAIGIKVDYTNYAPANWLPAILAAKYGASWFELSMYANSWVNAEYQTTPTAAWNPFHSTTPELQTLLDTMQKGNESDAATAARAANEYVVKNAWFAPWFRVNSCFPVNSKTALTLQADNAYPYLWNIKPKH